MSTDEQTMGIREYEVDPNKAMAGLVIFGAALVASAVTYVLGRFCGAAWVPMPLTFLSVLGTAGLTLTALLAVSEGRRHQEHRRDES